MSNNTDKQDEATQALLSMQGKVEPRSMSAEFIKKHFDPVSAHSQTPGPYARGNEGLTPNIDWKARAEAAEAEIARTREALTRTTVSLIAAISLLKGGGKKAAASDKMFEQMLRDYQRAVDLGCAALAKPEPADG